MEESNGHFLPLFPWEESNWPLHPLQRWCLPGFTASVVRPDLAKAGAPFIATRNCHHMQLLLELGQPRPRSPLNSASFLCRHKTLHRAKGEEPGHRPDPPASLLVQTCRLIALAGQPLSFGRGSTNTQQAFAQSCSLWT